jgi:hypothetical protein
MGIQFRLGPNDHKPVEDFLSRDHTGTDAITLDTKAARHQGAAAAAAVDAGLQVYWEPAAERLAEEGFGLDKFPLWTGQPYDIDNLSADQAARATLVGLTVEKHPSLVTHVTAPHFYVTDERTARLNVDLAERTRLAVGDDKPTRAVITVSTTALGRLGIDLAAEYASAGIRDIEIRLSPFGGDDEGIRKIRTAFGVLDQFREHDLAVTLGCQATSAAPPWQWVTPTPTRSAWGCSKRSTTPKRWPATARPPTQTRIRAAAPLAGYTCPDWEPPYRPRLPDSC